MTGVGEFRKYAKDLRGFLHPLNGPLRPAALRVAEGRHIRATTSPHPRMGSSGGTFVAHET